MPDTYDEVMARLSNTKPVVDRDPFIGPGQHDSLIVASIETFNDQKWGKSVRATFDVEASTLHPPGSGVVKIWNLFKPSKFPTQATDADQFAQFVCILQGIPEGQHAASCVALLKTRAEGGNAEAQPARGARIAAFGQEVGQPNPTTGRRYCRVQWRTVAQDGAKIAATRAQLDAKRPFTPAQFQQTPQAPAPVQYVQPAPVQYVQPAPVQYVQPAPVQYVQPVQQPVQAPPAGGFLSMLPGGR